jgi:alpha-L-fucosidase
VKARKRSPGRRNQIRKSKPQLGELLTHYGPIGLVWFDRGLFTTEQAQDFVQLLRGIQPACLVNGRVGNYEHELMGDYQNMGDNGMPAGGIEEDWETPQTLNDTWGYSRFDTISMSPLTPGCWTSPPPANRNSCCARRANWDRI